MAAVLEARLPAISPAGGARITSVYFDTARDEILAAARAQGRSIKVRVKEYETRDEAREVWLELKLREGERTGKLRTSVDRGRVLDVIADPSRAQGPLFDDLARLEAALAGALVPACTVSYQRLAWETEDESIRVTIDTRIRYAAGPAPPWGDESLAHAVPPAVGTFDGGILELKLRVPGPEWLTELVAQMGLERSPFSKFVAASDALAAS
jgi:hypothetical protein